MNKLINIAAVLALLALPAAALGQKRESGNTGVQRAQTAIEAEAVATPKTFVNNASALSDGDVQWLRIVYRELDLDKAANAALGYPADAIDGQENLLRIIMRLLANGKIAAYEYLDGREVFTDEYRIDVAEMLDRFLIPYSSGSFESELKIAEADIPVAEVASYYMIERREFDNRHNRVRTMVDALCPVLRRIDEFGAETLKYPMFWVKYSDLQPYLGCSQIFFDDDNNASSATYADYFALGRYEGEIYKTRNLRNLSLAEQFPNPDDLKRASDSIQHRLDTFEDKLWVPDREEIISAREAGDSIKASQNKRKAQKPKAKRNKAAKAKAEKSNGAASRKSVRSVRRKN